MNKLDIIGIIEKIKERCESVLYKIELLNNNTYEISEFCKNIPLLIDKIREMVPSQIYIVYEEYFDNFMTLSKQCSDREVLLLNLNIYVESLQLFVECLETLKKDVYDNIRKCDCCGLEGIISDEQTGNSICSNCGSNDYDRQIIRFLKQHNIVEAKEGFVVTDLSGGECVKQWMTLYCPQVKYKRIDDILDLNGFEDVIIGKKKALLEKKNEYVIREDGMILYVYSDCEEELDFSWKYEISQDLCTNGPLVSVLLPCYNHEDFVEAAILSVINQSYKNIEFLIADDASTDRTAEIIKKYEKYYTKSYYYNNNAGGRLTDLEKCATGKYIAVMHSDDMWHKDKLALQVEYMEANEDCACCFSWCRNTDKDGNIDNSQLFIQPNRSQTDWMRFFWENGNALCHPSALIRSNMYDRKYWKGKLGRQVPDLFKWVDLIQRYPIHIVTKDLTYMRRYQLENNENTSADTNKNVFSMHMEMGICWPQYLRDMDDKFFVETFAGCFLNREASTKEEIMCEKYFLLLSHWCQFVQYGAFAMLTDCYDEIGECLLVKYNYNVKEYRRDIRDKGLFQMFAHLL